MQILGRYCVLVSLYSVLELYVLRILVGFWVMDVASILKLLSKGSETGFGFFFRGSFFQDLNGFAMILIFVLCMRILYFGWPFKVLMLKNGVVEFCASMISSEVKLGDNESEVHDDDQEIDVKKLRKLVKIERERANFAEEELERERRASESATEEAMAMILRLQCEKSSMEMEANQFRRIAETKKQYDHKVIESLEWTKMLNESQITLLEQKLKLYREKLRQFMDEDDMEQFEDEKTFSDFCLD
ncbi:hypothetical protein QN277_009604 [Acacia crassicarpa]|uniref:GTD-binding domain-containing protein n=1 Tax=Acacia crassicarpa TaxID=499986 RepID=A0AAE1IPP3_9FABA|nr:hypothetical protein QN277_009604 [Acacia crassicarpa]